MNVFEDKSVFSKRLKKAMEENGMSMTDVSKKTGIPISTISRYISERMLPRIDYANRIATALNVNPSWLFGYGESKRHEESYMYCPWCGKRL